MHVLVHAAGWLAPVPRSACPYSLSSSYYDSKTKKRSKLDQSSAGTPTDDDDD